MLCILAKKFGNINFLKILKEAVLEISCKPVDAGELVGINGLKPVVKRNFFYEKLFSSGWKLKSCWKIWKPAVKSKKVAENMKTVESKKVAEKSLNQRFKVKKLLKNLKTSGWKQKSFWKYENGWKQKSCWKIFKPAVESKKVAEKS